ncbi:protein EARLY RESPONSIVE TO DEHYDRATION 15-like [Dioscorea cayenensis subsp. rotundata]|uniref:Protein EARLY RESPONSIVE TO DEHYDRATION 15-like n=1 Tax=Dioscorea cayennensis subsp. rotundata TaxID=55577 RepID=A0AB40BQR3_DIOCR|nr:protein EARLY RESPONSIVE TO DEHYDRATION 15-like [Dioscorea cayenensis subsp. rotundata]XP_039129651.1 protein EARLY RESPONSIVE TO DEHYDRATION 15-like [Dioscorea cayenensis subsp. rotundata]XP_039129652.1 protein EARLY RESPONSIVE TO DEHYDRATION 15-like [Dioscorea cayenensis subsp. rotundata]
MSAMAVANGGLRSTLNPNAPLFIPAALQQVEDFSPEWWNLVKTSTWFREHWISQHQDQGNFDGEDEDDIANLLPDDFDIGITEEMSILEAELEETIQEMEAAEETALASLGKEKTGPEMDAAAIIKNLSLKSPKNGMAQPVLEPAKYWEKPAQCIIPKCSPRRIIQQPR